MFCVILKLWADYKIVNIAEQLGVWAVGLDLSLDPDPPTF